MSIADALSDLASRLVENMAKSLNTTILAAERPQQHELFRLPPEGYWVYKVEYRLWLKFIDGSEGWSDWTSAEKRGVCRRWYRRRTDAEKAMERRKRGIFWTNRGREFRVSSEWSEFKPSKKH